MASLPLPLLAQILLTPSPLPISPLLALLETPTAGRSLFALAAIPPSTLLLLSTPPFARTVVEGYKREVCWTCFALVSRGRWTVREGGQEAAVRWFCSTKCWEEWGERVGEVGREAVRCGEAVLRSAQKLVQGKGGGEEGVELDEVAVSTREEMEVAWEAAGVVGEETIRRRTTKRGRGEGVWHPRREDVLRGSDDPDVYRLLLDGITARFHSAPLLLPTVLIPVPPESAWTNFTSLVPSLASNPRALASYIRMYLTLASTLPLPLLPQTSPTTILSILTRDIGNSFGIWGDAASDERGQLLAYGLYPSASLFNHSCRPNVVKRRAGELFEFVTAAEGEVAEGDEVCISYLGGGETGGREERRNKLMAGWGFWCQCERCREEKEEDDVGE